MPANPASVARRAIARSLQLPALAGAIEDGADLRDRLGADWLDMIAIAATIEDELDVSINDEELAAVVTVADVIGLAERKVHRCSAGGPDKPSEL